MSCLPLTSSTEEPSLYVGRGERLRQAARRKQTGSNEEASVRFPTSKVARPFSVMQSTSAIRCTGSKVQQLTVKNTPLEAE